MQYFSCVRALADNGILPALERVWDRQLRPHGESLDAFASPFLAHARKIVSEVPADPNYGIYVIHDPQGEPRSLFHANLAALPRTLGKTLRILWILNGPEYDYNDVSPADLAILVASIINGALTIAREDMVAQHLKIRLENSAERDLAAILAGIKKIGGSLVEVRGNWLHFDDLQRMGEGETA